MTDILLHYNGEWHIAYMSVVSDFDKAKGVRLPPFPAYYDKRDKHLICAFGEENFARELDEPTAGEVHEYEEHQRQVRIHGISEVFGAVTGRGKATWKMSDLRKLYQEQNGISDDQILEYIQLTWAERQRFQEKFLATACASTGCEPLDRPVPCSTCSLWPEFIDEFRRANSMTYHVKQAPSRAKKGKV